jgi:putative ABC transport system ATP-binding protein
MALVELNNVSKSYGNKIILDKLSLEVQEGEFVALRGVSGRGKSTILNIIGLLETNDSGKVIIDGESNIKPNSSRATKMLREKISYLFQNFALVDDETVQYNLEIAMKYIGGGKREQQVKMQNALETVGLQGFERRRIYELSGGEQQRVSMARIILKPSKLILADEPTGSLDEKNRNIIIDLLKKLNNEGKTIIVVTHDGYVANQCERVIDL